MDNLDPNKLANVAKRRPDLVVGGKVDTQQLQREADAMSEHEMAKFQGWAITMPIRRNELDPKLYETTYYLRAPNPHAAAQFAARIFMKWEKEEFEKYPDIDSNDPGGDIEGTCERLTDAQYKQAWNEANREGNKVFYHGNEFNPIVFTFYPPELPWVNPTDS
jgi:hypothetical protein